MAELSTEDRQRIWRGLQRYWSDQWEEAPDKAKILTTIEQTDTWMNDNRSSYLAALTHQASFTGAQIGLIYGITALAKEDWVVLTPEQLVRFDLTTVGVVYLVFAALGLFVAMGIFHGDLWARILGIIGASLNILAQMAFMSLYPAWSWFIIAIDGLVIYGLAVHGDEVAEL